MIKKEGNNTIASLLTRHWPRQFHKAVNSLGPAPGNSETQN